MDPLLPLDGKRILVPRGKKEAKSFSTLIEKYGGVPMEIPLIAFRPEPVSEQICNMINSINTYDWIIFTSNVTIETFLSYYSQTPSLPKVAVIGERTAAILERHGIKVDFTPKEFVAEGFVEEFLPLVNNGSKILIPKGNLARDYIGESLKNVGAIVDEVIVYETYLPLDSRDKLLNALLTKELDILTFTSPSTVDHFMEVVKEYQLEGQLKDCLISCIGPVTRDRIEAVGLKVDVMPKKYTVESMIKEIINVIHQS